MAYILHILAEETNGGSAFADIKPFILVAGVVIAAYMLMRWSQKRLSQNRYRDRASVQDRVDKVREGSEIYTQIGELMGQLADLSRQINGQIDTRIAKLEILLKDADQTIDRLEKLTGKSNRDLDLLEGSLTDNSGEALRKISEKYHHPTRSHPTEISPEKRPLTEGDKTEKKASGTSEYSSNNNDISLENQQIIDLAGQGMSAIEIAQELNRPVGEIELILTLKGKKSK